MKLFDCFSKGIIEKYGLLVTESFEQEKEADNFQPLLKQRKLIHTLNDLPEHHNVADMVEPDIEWECHHGRFLIVSDCQPLVNVINGHSPLTSPALAPPFRRVTEHLVAVLDWGWRPHQIHRDPIVWRRRGLNKKADFLVNYTMDIGQSWHKVMADGRIETNANFLIILTGALEEIHVPQQHG